MKNIKGLIICFTKYQKTIAYKHFSDNFKKYNIELDMLEMEDGNPMICEVNANPGGIEDNQ